MPVEEVSPKGAEGHPCRAPRLGATKGLLVEPGEEIHERLGRQGRTPQGAGEVVEPRVVVEGELAENQKVLLCAPAE